MGAPFMKSTKDSSESSTQRSVAFVDGYLLWKPISWCKAPSCRRFRSSKPTRAMMLITRESSPKRPLGRSGELRAGR